MSKEQNKYIRGGESYYRTRVVKAKSIKDETEARSVEKYTRGKGKAEKIN